MPRLTEVVKHLIVINVLMFFGTKMLMGDNRLMLALYYPGVEYFRPYQLVTHMFMHANFGHILFNMLSLAFLGPMIEQLWGSKRFLTYYLLAGFGAMFTHLAVRYIMINYFGQVQEAYIPVLGASGAIYGVFIAFAMYFPNARLMLLIPPIPVRAKYLVVGLIAYDLFSGLSGASTGVAHFAHLGGALFGFLIITYWRVTGKDQRYY